MFIAEFKKISERQFEKDAVGLDSDYQCIELPKRSTKGSAGYDFYSTVNITLKPQESIRIPTGIRCKIENGYVLELYPRSSLGFKYQMCLLNTVGIIDCDYYYAENEGHIMVGIVNRGNQDLVIHKGDRFVQGIFKQYFLAKEEEINQIRKGGFGSTN